MHLLRKRWAYRKGCYKKHGYPNDRGPARTRSGDGSASSASAKTNFVTGEPSVATNMVRLSGESSIRWILDTGASTHVCGDAKLFDYCYPISPINIGLPNGMNLVAHKAGTITLNAHLALYNVLLDRALTTIGVGELVDGLYYLTMKEPARVNVVNSLAHRGPLASAYGSDNGTELRGLVSYFKEHGIIHQTSMVKTPQQNARVERKHRHILNVARALRFQSSLPVDFWGQYFQSRDVRFVESNFPFAETIELSQDGTFFDDPNDMGFVPPSSVVPSSTSDPEFSSPEPAGSRSEGGCVSINESNDDQADGDGHSSIEQNDVPIVIEQDVISSELSKEFSNEHDILLDTTDHVDEMGRGKRIKFDNTNHKDFVRWEALRNHINTTFFPVSSAPSAPTSMPVSGTPYSIANYVNYAKFSDAHQRYLAAITTDVEPTSFKEAIRDPRWKQAMEAEIDALEANHTWTIEELPADKKALGCMWVYKIKRNSDGAIERFKARLVTFGNHQIEGVDFVETFAPTVKMVTVRAFLTIAAINNWELHQMDVHNAFLHGDLVEEVYMRLPPGFGHGLQGKVCRLRKSLYGLRQAPRCWYAKLAQALHSYGFAYSPSDHSLFIYRKGEIVINILVYVDDLVIAGNDGEAIHKFKAYLNTCFRMKDLGKLKYFLGLEVARNSTGIFLCQRKYTLDLISETGLLGSKPATVPMDEKHDLESSLTPLFSDPTQYRRLVGKLIYLTLTRPEISYAVHLLSRFMKAPSQSHWNAVLRVLRYLKGQPGQGILLRANAPLELEAYCDL
ncbi:uncharacterized protein LOC141620880 [Silene latifolia]|uniref:uncharacterized protein LOC141620880 n=1 Tax=Silene latifolia TaxID=37657 RepID=UPI003D77A7CE